MKTNAKLLIVLVTLILSTLINTKQISAQYADVSLQVFYDQLSPYGYWINNPTHGYVWVPNVDQDFAPYSTSGYWVMTDYGMTWVSDYNWGWAPFHYGRWDYDNFYGWFWVPGNEWGPAWVTWRSADGYYGWEPMQPGISVTLSFGNHYNNNYNRGIFVRAIDIDRHNIHHYCVRHDDYEHILRNSTVINNTYIDNSRHVTYVSGPRREELHRNIGRDVRIASIHENNSPGQDFRNDRLNIYRPQITENNDNNRRSAPGRISDINEIQHRPNNNSTREDQTNNNRNRQENTNRSTDNNKNQHENTNQLDQNNRNRERVINNSDNNNRNEQENIKRLNENNRNQQKNNNQSEQINRNRQENTNNNNQNKRENINRTNENNRNKQQNNMNQQNRNNHSNVNSSNNNRNSNRNNSKSEKNKESNSREDRKRK